jgi:hypothetical protein
MLPQRSFFNPVRHKRITCFVAIATTSICIMIMAQSEGYVELAKTVLRAVYQFMQQIV